MEKPGRLLKERSSVPLPSRKYPWDETFIRRAIDAGKTLNEVVRELIGLTDRTEIRRAITALCAWSRARGLSFPPKQHLIPSAYDAFDTDIRSMSASTTFKGTADILNARGFAERAGFSAKASGVASYCKANGIIKPRLIRKGLPGARRLTEEEDRRRTPNNMEWLEPYQGAHRPRRCRCRECGCEWKPSPQNVWNYRSACPSCSQHDKAQAVVFWATKALLGLGFEECDLNKRPPFLGGLEADIYVPKYDLVIEYQGIQHYEPGRFHGRSFVEVPNDPSSLAAIQERDKRKKQSCADAGKHLILIDGQEMKIWEMRKRLEPRLRREFEARSIPTEQTTLDFDSIFRHVNVGNALRPFIPEINRLNDGTMALKEAFEMLKARYPQAWAFESWSRFRNTVFRNFVIPWRTPKDVIAQYASEIEAESATGRSTRESFLEILKKKHPEDVPLQKVTPDAFGEWLSRNRLRWKRPPSDGMRWMLDHEGLVKSWYCDERLSLTEIVDRLDSKGVSTTGMTVLAFFETIGVSMRSVSEGQRTSKRFKAAQKAKPNPCGNFGPGYRPWSNEELRLLKQLRGEGKSAEYMSLRLNRSIRAICHKITEIQPTVDAAHSLAD